MKGAMLGSQEEATGPAPQRAHMCNRTIVGTGLVEKKAGREEGGG